MPDEVLQNSVDNPASFSDAPASPALTKQDVQEVVDSAVSSLAGVDGKSLSDVCGSLSSVNSVLSSDTSISAQLDYINSGVLLNAVLVGAVLGAVIMRFFLDHFGRRAH